MQERDILISLLDMSHAGDGYPNISAGHVSCMRGISSYLRWTCLMHERDILISLLDLSHAGDGYPYISAGHVSCTRGISLYLRWTCLMQGWISLYLRWTCLMHERDILISQLDLPIPVSVYPHISAGPVSSKGSIS